MSKISKFIICCIAIIISICSLCVPTYCAEISSMLFEVDYIDEFPNYNNYYNASNISYVSYKNFNIIRNTQDVLYGTNVSNLPSSFTNGKIFTDNYNDTFYGFPITIESTYKLRFDSSAYRLSLESFNVSGLENIVLNLKPSETSAIFSFHVVPFEFLNGLNGKLDSLHIYPHIILQFEVDYNGQYFYNDTFCITNKFSITNGVVNTLNPTSTRNLRKELFLTDNYGDLYYRSLYSDNSNNFNGKYLSFYNRLYTDRYLTKLRTDYIASYLSFGNVIGLNRLYYQIDLKYVDFDEINSINLFSGNSSGSGGAVGSLIPNGSNNFYKTAEWWDIPSHLYNFFIYLIFDAPIISNFTNLVMVIINFIIELFEFFIGLFTGINNIFFISIFIGIIVLIFLLKIIFKG